MSTQKKRYLTVNFQLNHFIQYFKQKESINKKIFLSFIILQESKDIFHLWAEVSSMPWILHCLITFKNSAIKVQTPNYQIINQMMTLTNILKDNVNSCKEFYLSFDFIQVSNWYYVNHKLQNLTLTSQSKLFLKVTINCLFIILFRCMF